MVVIKCCKVLGVWLSIQFNVVMVNDVMFIDFFDGMLYVEYCMYGGFVFGKEKLNSLQVIIMLVFGVLEFVVFFFGYICLQIMLVYIVLCYEVLCQQWCVKLLSSVDLSKVKWVIGVG